MLSRSTTACPRALCILWLSPKPQIMPHPGSCLTQDHATATQENTAHALGQCLGLESAMHHG